MTISTDSRRDSKFTIYPVHIEYMCYVMASSPEEAEDIAQSNLSEITQQEYPMIGANDPQETYPKSVMDSLPWVNRKYSGPEQTVEQIMNNQS